MKSPGTVDSKLRAEQRDLHAATFGAEDERDCVRWTCRTAGAVPDAIRWPDQMRLAVDQTEYVVLRLFRTGFYARIHIRCSGQHR